MERAVLVYTTWPSIVEAERAGRAILEQRLAACVNILSPNVGVYRWKGNIEESEETPMIVKTTAQRKDEAVRIIESLHSYETPGIVCWDADSLHADYSAWMTENLKDLA